MQEDSHFSLKDIRNQYQGDLVSQLLKLQKHLSKEEKSLEWARDLLCLCRSDLGGQRRREPDERCIIDSTSSTKILRQI